MTEARASIVFCDDYREEVNGKFSLMGLYSGYLGLPAPRSELPKLCVVTMFELPRLAQYPKISVSVDWAQQTTSFDLDVQALTRAPAPPPGAPTDRIWISIPAQGVLIPLEAGQTLSATAHFGNAVLAQAKLAVVHNEKLDLQMA
jgi:hypothetical protein